MMRGGLGGATGAADPQTVAPFYLPRLGGKEARGKRSAWGEEGISTKPRIHSTVVSADGGPTDLDEPGRTPLRTWTDPSTDLDGPLYGPGPDSVEAELNLGGEGATPEFPAPTGF